LSQKDLKRPPKALRKGKWKNDVNTQKYQESLYVLKQKEGKWFLGKCLDEYLDKRIKRYLDGRGNEWTATYPVLKVERVVKNGNLRELILEYMEKYGWENVRGNPWTSLHMEGPPRDLKKE